MKKQRLNVHIYTNPQCNLKCKHCYSAFNSKLGDELSIGEILSVISGICSEYDAYFDVEGGELFLRDDIEKLLEQLTPFQRSRITFTTNGTIYPEVKASYLKELDEFRVSIEGHTDSLQRSLRGVDLQPILNNCTRWMEQDISVVLRMTLTKKNYCYIPKVFEYFVPIGFRRFSFYEFQPMGRGELNEEEYCLNEEAFDDIIQHLYDGARQYTQLDYVKLNLSKRRNEVVDRYLNAEGEARFDMEDMSIIPTLTINYNGEIGKCPWKISENKKTNLRNGNFMEDVSKLVKSQGGRHDCDFCSERKLKFKLVK